MSQEHLRYRALLPDASVSCVFEPDEAMATAAWPVLGPRRPGTVARDPAGVSFDPQAPAVFFAAGDCIKA